MKEGMQHSLKNEKDFTKGEDSVFLACEFLLLNFKDLKHG